MTEAMAEVFPHVGKPFPSQAKDTAGYGGAGEVRIVHTRAAEVSCGPQWRADGARIAPERGMTLAQRTVAHRAPLSLRHTDIDEPGPRTWQC